jgi:hypothetical protein
MRLVLERKLMIMNDFYHHYSGLPTPVAVTVAVTVAVASRHYDTCMII